MESPVELMQFVKKSLMAEPPPQEILNSEELNEIDLHGYNVKTYMAAFKTRLNASSMTFEEFMTHPELFPRGSTAERNMSMLCTPVWSGMERSLASRDWVKAFAEHQLKQNVQPQKTPSVSNKRCIRVLTNFCFRAHNTIRRTLGGLQKKKRLIMQ
jgi:hypothetical protein